MTHSKGVLSVGKHTKPVYHNIKRITRKALQEIPVGYWLISNSFEEDANGEMYPFFIRQMPFTNERQFIWEELKELKLTGQMAHAFEKIEDARVMFDYDYDGEDWGLER
jgi:CRISPR/Cas system-associated endonuclease/helicase Cas3